MYIVCRFLLPGMHDERLRRKGMKEWHRGHGGKAQNGLRGITHHKLSSLLGRRGRTEGGLMLLLDLDAYVRMYETPPKGLFNGKEKWH